MKKMPQWLLLVVVCNLLICQRLEAAGTGTAAKFRISGVALSRRDGAPIPFCHVHVDAVVEPDQAGGPGTGAGASDRRLLTASVPAVVDTATADEEGRFSLEVPRAGAWQLTGEARGFRRQAYEEHEEYSSAVVLTDREPAVALQFRMVPDSSITGTVADEAGEAVRMAGILVEKVVRSGSLEVSSAVSGERAMPSWFAMTDDRGMYEVAGLGPGEYRVRIEARPWYSTLNGSASGTGNQGASSRAGSHDPSLDKVYDGIWFPGVDDEAEAELIALHGGEDREADFHLLAIPAVSLRVGSETEPASRPSGKPGRERTAMLFKVGPNGTQPVGSMTTTGNDLQFGGLQPGTYELRLGEQGREAVEVRQIEVRPGSAGVIGLEGAQALTPVGITLEGAGAEAAGPVVFVDTEDGRRIRATPAPEPRRENQADAGPASARVRLPMQAGTQTVSLLPHTYEVNLLNAGPSYLTALHAAGTHVNGRTLVVGDQEVKLTLSVASGRAQVVGFAERDGKAAAGVMVLLVPAALGQASNLGEIARDQTNTDGSFRMDSVVPGQYILVAIERGWETEWRKTATLSKYLPKGVPVEVRAQSRTRTRVPVQLP